MLGYRKRSFMRAHVLLHTLLADPNDLAALKNLQILLLNEIIRAEENIRKLKTELRIVAKISDRVAEKRSAYLKKRIEGVRRCTYIWRCFGDAIAFFYMDKFALKHTFYSTENVNAKQSSGFVIGKEGLRNELAMLNSALSNNVPALLVDLTNTIRHGDICLMGESDPFLIEVKTSNKVDRRGRQQKRSLQKLRDFYETDESDNLRGYPQLRRQSYETPERSHVDQINECIRIALEKGYSILNPELGLYYIAVAEIDTGLNQAIASLELKSPWWFPLNQVKSDRQWAPYTPFTLSIVNKDHLWAFIQGTVFLLVIVETDMLCQIALNKGYNVSFDKDDELYPLRIKTSDGGEGGVSKHMLDRIGFEFSSPEWIVLSAIEAIEHGFSVAIGEVQNSRPILSSES